MFASKDMRNNQHYCVDQILHVILTSRNGLTCLLRSAVQSGKPARYN
jgi:hypothetical protein